jgi:hypothetical protein
MNDDAKNQEHSKECIHEEDLNPVLIFQQSINREIKASKVELGGNHNLSTIELEGKPTIQIPKDKRLLSAIDEINNHRRGAAGSINDGIYSSLHRYCALHVLLRNKDAFSSNKSIWFSDIFTPSEYIFQLHHKEVNGLYLVGDDGSWEKRVDIYPVDDYDPSERLGYVKVEFSSRDIKTIEKLSFVLGYSSGSRNGRLLRAIAICYAGILKLSCLEGVHLEIKQNEVTQKEDKSLVS